MHGLVDIDVKFRLVDRSGAVVEVRRLRCPAGSYWAVRSTAAQLFGLEDFALQYDDFEGDRVTLGSEAELAASFEARPSKKNVPDFYVAPDDDGGEQKKRGSRVLGPMHPGVRCDSCGSSPIRGARFKCTVRGNYDLCERCEPRDRTSHPLIKLREPGLGRFLIKNLAAAIGNKQKAAVGTKEDDDGGAGQHVTPTPASSVKRARAADDARGGGEDDDPRCEPPVVAVKKCGAEAATPPPPQNLHPVPRDEGEAPSPVAAEPSVDEAMSRRGDGAHGDDKARGDESPANDDGDDSDARAFPLHRGGGGGGGGGGDGDDVDDDDDDKRAAAPSEGDTNAWEVLSDVTTKGDAAFAEAPVAIGDAVELHSLTSAQFNGRVGKVVDAAGKRLVVELGDGTKVALKPGNMRRVEQGADDDAANADADAAAADTRDWDSELHILEEMGFTSLLGLSNCVRLIERQAVAGTVNIEAVVAEIISQFDAA